MKSILAFICGILLSGGVYGQDVIKVAPDQTGEAISPYIYGQFIEHLGRSIYGGIWAEMLEDRKFCFPVTDKYDPWGTAEDQNWKSGPYKYLKASPWKVMGPVGSVTMDTDHAYVGAHSVAVHGGGISQDGLALLAGHKYVGRIVLAGDASAAAPVVVRIVQDDGAVVSESVDRLSSNFQTYPLTFMAGGASDNARIEITSAGSGTFRIGTVSLMPEENIDGFRPDTLALLKELRAPTYRWPGGNFVSGYNWHDGVGDPDKRPPRRNPAWKGVESNDVGIHEYMDLMKLIQSEPYVAINTGLGTVPQASEEVEYFNGSADTPMGKLRAKNGHAEPFNVKFWAVGNEMFGKWQLGYMAEEKYVVKHNLMADAIWKISPEAQLIAVGDPGAWDQMMLAKCADHMNLLSEHVYVKDDADVVKHTGLLAAAIKNVARSFREDQANIPQMKGRNIRIAMDEWNYWYGPYIYGELGVQYHLKDALGVARGFHEYFRNSDIFYMASYAQTVNVIGAIKTSRTAATLDATGEALVMYHDHFGTVPMAVVKSPADLDVSAAWSADKGAVTIAIVNSTAGARDVTLEAPGVNLGEVCQQWVLSGADALSHNVPGEAPEVTVVEKEVTVANHVLSSPALSVVIYRLVKG